LEREAKLVVEPPATAALPVPVLALEPHSPELESEMEGKKT